MVILKNRIIGFLIIISGIILINLIFSDFAIPASETQIIIDENLKPGMPLKDAIELLGPPERMTPSNSGTIVIPYDALGLSIEIINGGTIIEKIHVLPSFKGRFASGIEMGADFQKILSAYNQPDIMTKDIIDYSDLARRFQIREGKLTGAVLYSATGTTSNFTADKEAVKNEVVRTAPEAVSEEVPEEILLEEREALREELRDEIRKEVREEFLEEVNKEVAEEFDVFDLYGFKVKQVSDSVIISEITPGSVAEKGGLIEGEPVRKAFYEGGQKLNIYYVKGLKSILERSIINRKKIVHILQNKNYYYKVEVPARK